MFESDSSDVFHSPSSVAIYTPVRALGTEKRLLGGPLGGGLGCAKRILPRSGKKEDRNEDKKEDNAAHRITATPPSTRRHKALGHYMKTTEASRYFLTTTLRWKLGPHTL